MRRTELRGRERELELLYRAADDARAGSGATVLVEGEAGIGKTRLIDELAGHADELGMRIGRGAAEELEQDRPFGALVQALGTPDTQPSASGTEEARVVVQDAFVDHVEHLAASPLLLALDDLQWADRSTLTTAWALARRAQDMGLLLVLAFRPAPRPPALARVIEGCGEIGAARIDVGPIPDAALDELALDVLGVVPDPAVVQQLQGAGGNPFVAIELLASVAADAPVPDVDDAGEKDSRLPSALRSALLRRFTGLSETSRHALPVASVLGSAADVDDLAALVGMSADQASEVIAEAVAAGLLEPAGDALVFRHDLIREALYEDTPAPVRAAWHREAARRLKGRADPSVVARHLLLSASHGDDETVAELRKAAESLDHGAPDVAAALLQRAIGMTADPTALAELGRSRAEALLAGGRAEEAERQSEDALAAPLVMEATRARLHVARARALTFQGRFGEARTGYEQALAEGVLDERWTASVLGWQAMHCVFTLALDDALHAAEQAEAIGSRVGAKAAVSDALFARCTVHTFRSELEDAVDAGREAVAFAESDPALPPNDVLFGMALVGFDRLDEARAVTESGLRRAVAHGHVLSVPTHQMTLAWLEWIAGRWDAALAEVETLAGLAEDYGLRIGDPIGHAVVGTIAFHRDDRATARTSLEAGRARGVRGGVVPLNLLARLSAELMEADGDLQGAASTIMEPFEFQRMVGIDTGRSMLGVDCVRLVAGAGNTELAEDLVVDLGEYGARAGTASARGTAAYARGVVERDGVILVEAAADFDASSRTINRLRALEAAGDAFVDSGARQRAEAPFREALTVADELGAVHDARRIAAALRGLGVRVGVKDQAPRPTHGWDAVTSAERQVAVLVGEGLRNGEIAERLFISKRTVETHVSRLRQKLGTGNRVELVATIRDYAGAVDAG